MKTLVICLAVCAAISIYMLTDTSPSSEIEAQFREFLDTYKVGYGTTDEYNYRLNVFVENMKESERLNEENPLAEFGITQFSDQTTEEMIQRMGFIKPNDSEQTSFTESKESYNYSSVSWEHLWNGVIKSQGKCGSCWAFAVTSAFEARYALEEGKETIDQLFSEQQLVDCCTGSSGCGGGYLDSTFNYLARASFCSEDDYPYRAVQETCADQNCVGGPSDKGGYIFAHSNEQAVLEGLMSGPVAVCLDAHTWANYRGGILTDCGRRMNHCVTAVASNFEDPTPYIRFRNSWSAGWGENGHINLAIGENLCGYADYGEVPVF